MNLVILNSCSEIILMHLCKKEFYYFEIKKSIMATSLDSIPDHILLQYVLSHLEIGEILAFGRTSRKYREIYKDESIWINLLNKINTFAFPAPVFLFESSFNLAKRFVIDLFNEARKKPSLKSLIPTFFTSSLGLTTNKINTFITAKKTSEVAKKYCITPADDLDLHAALAGSYRTYPA